MSACCSHSKPGWWIVLWLWYHRAQQVFVCLIVLQDSHCICRPSLIKMSLSGTSQATCSKTCSNALEHQWLKYVLCMYVYPLSQTTDILESSSVPPSKRIARAGLSDGSHPSWKLREAHVPPPTYLQLCLNCMWSWGAARAAQGKPRKGLHLCSCGKSIITAGSKHSGAAFVVEEHPHPVGEPSPSL